MAYTVADMRVEMGRLTQVMMAKNAEYLHREQELEQLYRDDPVLLKARRDDDYRLNKAGNTAKSCAVLVTALASVIAAEVAYVEHQRR